jgi:radical SAM superfamily enzyme YgiQ (UPF0313 family)
VTPKKHSIKIQSEYLTKIDFDSDVDLVGITAFTVTAPRAYEIADEFKRRGVEVVLGGWHVSALPNEGLEHAISVIVGEAENIWPQLLNDLENDKLKRIYRQKEPVDLNSIPLLTKLERKRYNISPFVQTIEASRGCPYNCTFCSISNNEFGRVYRTKSINKIITEIQSIPEKLLNFCDPSLTLNPSYTKQLFHEMRGLNKKFFCEGNVNILAVDEELLKLASEAGCLSWCIGFESVSQETLVNMGKEINKIEKYASTTKKIHDYGMCVKGSFVLGFDTDGPNVFDSTLEAIRLLNLDIVDFNILTPFPGTPIFNQLDSEGRILTKDWSKYDTENVVFRPKQMSPDELFSKWKAAIKEYYSFINFLKMNVRTLRLGFYQSLISFPQTYYYNKLCNNFN